MHIQSDNKVIRKYLTTYCEVEANVALDFPFSFERCVVIPAYGEENLLRTLSSLPEPVSTLSIVVVNASVASPASMRDANRRCLEALKGAADLLWSSPVMEHVCLLRIQKQHVMLVDRSQPHNLFPEKQGVGLARKIGADVAFALFCNGRVRSPWIFCTDADVVLPADYFESVPNLGVGTGIFSFWHEPDPGLEEVTGHYEIWLRYYLLGLAYSESPYAFHSMGSCIVTHATTYAQVRGFPKRQAGEDFYMLNKLAKNGPVYALTNEPVCLAGRESRRVPFGTGRAIIELMRDEKSYRFYDPKIFEYLRVWLQLLGTMARLGCPDELSELQLQDPAEIDLRKLHDVVGYEQIKGPLKRLLNGYRTFELRLRALHTWFDGFRTLRFVHDFRDRYFPSLELAAALQHARFVKLQPSHNLLEMRHDIFLLEQKLPRQVGLGALAETASSR